MSKKNSDEHHTLIRCCVCDEVFPATRKYYHYPASSKGRLKYACTDCWSKVYTERTHELKSKIPEDVDEGVL